MLSEVKLYWQPLVKIAYIWSNNYLSRKMKKIIFTFGLVTLLAGGISAQTTSNNTNDATKTEKSCANKKKCTKGKACCKKTAATNGTADATATKSCCKNSGKTCNKAKATENTSTK